MNLKRELDMPVILGDSGRPITLREMAASGRGGVELRERVHGKLATFSVANEAVAHLSGDSERLLAIERLKKTPEAVFRFVDGKKFTALQAADEVQRGTAVGKYFAKIQKRAAEIALEAFVQGKIQL